MTRHTRGHSPRDFSAQEKGAESACSRCRSRRIRCSPRTPCAACVQGQTECLRPVSSRHDGLTPTVHSIPTPEVPQPPLSPAADFLGAAQSGSVRAFGRPADDELPAHTQRSPHGLAHLESYFDAVEIVLDSPWSDFYFNHVHERWPLIFKPSFSPENITREMQCTIALLQFVPGGVLEPMEQVLQLHTYLTTKSTEGIMNVSSSIIASCFAH